MKIKVTKKEVEKDRTIVTITTSTWFGMVKRKHQYIYESLPEDKDEVYEGPEYPPRPPEENTPPELRDPPPPTRVHPI